MQNSQPKPSLIVIDGSKQDSISPIGHLEAIRNALSETKTLEASAHWRAKAKALEEVTKAANVSHEIKVEAAELRIRWERKLGEAMKIAPKHKGTRRQLKGSPYSGGSIIDPPEGAYDSSGSHNKSLSTLGINKSLADRARKLAEIPQDAFDDIVAKRVDSALSESNKALDKRISTNAIIRGYRQSTRPQKEPDHSPIIKPMDNWNFSAVVYDRISVEGEDYSHGYIPGELYANCLWYWTKEGDKVVAPMAGSGQIIKVWEDRKKWMRPEEWSIDLNCYDLTPRGPYANQIKKNDLTVGLPEKGVNYIVMDVPYFGMVKGQYSSKTKDLANATEENEWINFIKAIAKNCSQSQPPEGLCTVITPNFRDLSTGMKFIATHATVLAFEESGYFLVDKAYASRRIQQAQNPVMARSNKQAKERRIMLTDISEVLTFQLD